jgi:glycosyltransferase involved in cell wall biosynthesis
MAACTGFHPLILAAQGQNIAYNNSRIKSLFCKYAISKADMIHAWGDNMAKKLTELGADPKKLFILPRGIDTERFRPVDSSIDFPHTFRIITTRGLKPDYNFEQIIEAVKILRKKRNNFLYVIVGDGPYKKRIVDLVRLHEIQDVVEFVGKVGYYALPDYLKSSDIYVSAVITDGVSASLLEAMSCGVFPIVTDNESNRLWIKTV